MYPSRNLVKVWREGNTKSFGRTDENSAEPVPDHRMIWSPISSTSEPWSYPRESGRLPSDLADPVAEKGTWKGTLKMVLKDLGRGGPRETKPRSSAPSPGEEGGNGRRWGRSRP